MAARVVRHIPINDLKAQHASIESEVMAAVGEVIAAQSFILGEPVAAFERALEAYVGVSHAVGVASGSDALRLALLALGIGPGDAVLTTPLTFFATAGAIANTGATPVFADIDPCTMQLSAGCVRDSISRMDRAGPRLRAILVVHLFGSCADMDALGAVAKEHGLYVVEDAAQAMGATYGARHAGSIGTLGCTSFFPSKTLGGWGDGGAVFTSDPNLASRVRRLRVHGLDGGGHVEVGFNSRLDALQAAVLSVKLRHLESWLDKRARAASIYRELLAPIAEVTTPEKSSKGRDVFSPYVVRVKRRDLLAAHLRSEGIETRCYYPSLVSSEPCFRGSNRAQLPNAEQARGETLAIPLFAEITLDEQTYVAEAIARFR